MGKLPEKFGKIVRGRRGAAGLSQEALADKAGLHRTYIGMLERGERTPTIVVVKQLAEALGTTMVSLIQELEGSTIEEQDEPADGRNLNLPSSPGHNRATDNEHQV